MGTEDVAVAELFLALPEVQLAIPRNTSLHWEAVPIGLGQRTYRRLIITEEDPFVTGDMLETATAQRDPQFNQPQVAFQFNRAGGRRFSNFTTQHIGDYIAIVLDDEIVSAPVVQDRIGAAGVINMGNADMVEAGDLALVLRAGALPARLEIMEERTVGPSLGQDSIDRGRVAGIIGLVFVVLIMSLYYHVAGLLAVMALGVYVLLVLGGLSAFGFTLTLPGMAGLILSVGMAVDANVLIFERIRERVDPRAGHSDCGRRRLCSRAFRHRGRQYDNALHRAYSLPVWHRARAGVRGDARDRDRGLVLLRPVRDANLLPYLPVGEEGIRPDQHLRRIP